jgi:hypothetical protein
MKPNDEIKKFMAAELAAGVTLSEVQNVINERFGCKLTFMDIRILAAEIESIDWSSRDPAPVEPKADEPAAAGEAAPGGKTKIETSKILRPGTLAGGTVKFASGASAEWFVDQRGQLGLDKVKGEPTETDVSEFQQELQKLFGR